MKQQKQKLEDNVSVLKDTVQRLDKDVTYLKCGVKDGHTYIYNRYQTDECYSILGIWMESLREYVFRCSKCGYEVCKYEKQLSVKERNALISLGILKKPDAKKGKKC